MPSPVDAIPQTTPDFAAIKYLMYQLVLDGKYQRVVEIGTNVGDSTRIFSTALQATNGKLWTIDLEPPTSNWPEQWPVKNIEFIKSDSLLCPWSQEIDVLFLDGNHEAPHVKAELVKYGPWVLVGGKILAHDIHHSQFGPGITSAIHEWCHGMQLCWTDYPHQHGLAVIEVSHPLPRV